MTVTAREARENSKANDVENMVTESEVIEQFGNEYVQSIQNYTEGYTVHIIHDIDPSNPRDDDNLGTMVCFHNRYDLGDKDHGYSLDECESWSDLEGLIDSDWNGGIISLPLWLLDHSGIWMQTGPFSCDSQGWDSGVVGLIYVPKSKVREEYSVKRISSKIRARAISCLTSEIEEYSNYIAGYAYGYVVTGPDGDEIDSCWGYLGLDYDKNGINGAAHAAIDHDVTEREKFAMRS